MNTSSPTAPTELTTLAIKCPDWCTTPAEDHDDDGMIFVEGVADLELTVKIGHGGPRWGESLKGYATTDALTGRISAAYVDSDGLDDILDGAQDPSVLRQLATDLLAAAEWLEAQQ